MVMADIIVVMGPVMSVISMIEVHYDIGKQHMLVMVMTHDQMLDTPHDAGDFRQRENCYQRDAKQRACLLGQVLVRRHPDKLALNGGAGNRAIS